MTLKFITGNKNKVKEAQAILKPIKVKQVKFDLDEIQNLEPHKIIKHKLQEAFKHHKGPFILEDDSLYLDCLGGKLPGPLIKWFNDTIGNKGLAKLTKKMGNNKATVQSIVGYAKNPKQIKFFESKLKGKIVLPRGSFGFGYDPIFVLKGLKQTYSELKKAGKLDISTRGKAMKKLKKYLEKVK